MNTAQKFLHDEFKPDDNLAVVLIHRRVGEVLQRIAQASHIRSDEFQDWLRRENDAGFEIYVSMNTLKAGARGRTKRDLSAIRHVFLDIDQDGAAVLSRLKARIDLPPPNAILTTSPSRYQVLWRVELFSAEQAESLQRGLARQTGADIAATDATRVLRLPGFVNHKYASPHLVAIEPGEIRVSAPHDFPAVFAPEPDARHGNKRQEAADPQGIRVISQSERDWAFAKRSLARGETPTLVADVITAYRRFDKSNPRDYAERTVRKAVESMSSVGQRLPEQLQNLEAKQIER